MVLVINSVKTCVYYLFLSNLQAYVFKELQHRSVLLHAEEGQQVRADGLLPSTPIDLGSQWLLNNIMILG